MSPKARLSYFSTKSQTCCLDSKTFFLDELGFVKAYLDREYMYLMKPYYSLKLEPILKFWVNQLPEYRIRK